MVQKRAPLSNVANHLSNSSFLFSSACRRCLLGAWAIQASGSQASRDVHYAGSAVLLKGLAYGTLQPQEREHLVLLKRNTPPSLWFVVPDSLISWLSWSCSHTRNKITDEWMASSLQWLWKLWSRQLDEVKIPAGCIGRGTDNHNTILRTLVVGLVARTLNPCRRIEFCANCTSRFLHFKTERWELALIIVSFSII